MANSRVDYRLVINGTEMPCSGIEIVHEPWEVTIKVDADQMTRYVERVMFNALEDQNGYYYKLRDIMTSDLGLSNLDAFDIINTFKKTLYEAIHS